MKLAKCIECGIGAVKPLAIAGRRERYKNLEVEVPADLEIPTCDNCGEQYFDAATAKAYDAALEPIYRSMVRDRLVAALVALTNAGASLRRLEAALSLSEGYLSKVKQGRAEASPLLVSNLALLAANPGAINTLERIWTGNHDAVVEGSVGKKGVVHGTVVGGQLRNKRFGPGTKVKVFLRKGDDDHLGDVVPRVQETTRKPKPSTKPVARR